MKRASTAGFPASKSIGSSLSAATRKRIRLNKAAALKKCTLRRLRNKSKQCLVSAPSPLLSASVRRKTRGYKTNSVKFCAPYGSDKKSGQVFSDALKLLKKTRRRAKAKKIGTLGRHTIGKDALTVSPTRAPEKLERIEAHAPKVTAPTSPQVKEAEAKVESDGEKQGKRTVITLGDAFAELSALLHQRHRERSSPTTNIIDLTCSPSRSSRSGNSETAEVPEEKQEKADQVLVDIVETSKTSVAPVMPLIPTAGWLEDSDVHELFSFFVRKASRSLKQLGFQPQYAYPLDRIRVMRALSRSDNIFGDCATDVTFVPINWTGCHWFLVVLDFRSSRFIVFWDPLGNNCPGMLKTALLSRFTDAVFLDLVERVQYDDEHCGAWCVFLAEEYVTFCDSGVDPTSFGIAHSLVKINTDCLEERQENIWFIRSWRTFFSLMD